MKYFKFQLVVSIFCIQSCIHLNAQPTGREISNTSFTFWRNNTPLKLAYFSSPTLEVTDTKIDRLVIVVHGNSRNPFTYFTNMMKAAEKAGAVKHTLVISPGFVMERDFEGNRDLLTDDHLFWSNAGWKQGDYSLTDSKLNPRKEKLS